MAVKGGTIQSFDLEKGDFVSKETQSNPNPHGLLAPYVKVDSDGLVWFSNMILFLY